MKISKVRPGWATATAVFGVAALGLGSLSIVPAVADTVPTSSDLACAFSNSGTTMTLTADCTTDDTIEVPNGWTLDGAGHSITAIDPAGGHFVGAVVANGGTSANVHDLTVTASNLVEACDAGEDRLRGILFDNASGSITDSTVHGVRQAFESGCQEGNAIEARNFKANGSAGTPKLSVTISGNTVYDYQKNGITANGGVAATITENTVIGEGEISYIAQNGIQVGYGASATIGSNPVSDNYYLPPDVEACGILLYKAGNVKLTNNYLVDNEVAICGKAATRASRPHNH